MNTFFELSNDEIMSIDGGGFWSKIAHAATAWGAYELAGACFAAITVSAPTIAIAGLVMGGLGFGVVAAIAVGGILVD